jgi:hypothetical protein
VMKNTLRIRRNARVKSTGLLGALAAATSVDGVTDGDQQGEVSRDHGSGPVV